MPKLELRKPDEVPAPLRASKAVQEQQRLYEGFIRQLDGNVGELEMETGDQIRSVKVRLRRAATRLGSQLEIWDANGKVYFRSETLKRRGRPRKTE